MSHKIDIDNEYPIYQGKPFSREIPAPAIQTSYFLKKYAPQPSRQAFFSKNMRPSHPDKPFYPPQKTRPGAIMAAVCTMAVMAAVYTIAVLASANTKAIMAVVYTGAIMAAVYTRAIMAAIPWPS